MAQKRIQKEIELFNTDCGTNISLQACKDNNNLNCRVCVLGSDDSLYEGGMFELDVLLPDEYPFAPPAIKFVTPIYHLNVSLEGKICLRILDKHYWSPALTILRSIEAIIALMNDPNYEDPLVPEIAHIYKTDKKKYEETAREWTKKYAM